MTRDSPGIPSRNSIQAWWFYASSAFAKNLGFDSDELIRPCPSPISYTHLETDLKITIRDSPGIDSSSSRGRRLRLRKITEFQPRIPGESLLIILKS